MTTSNDLRDVIMELLQGECAKPDQVLVDATQLDGLAKEVDDVTLAELAMDVDHLVSNPSFPETAQKLEAGELFTIGELVDAMVAECPTDDG